MNLRNKWHGDPLTKWALDERRSASASRGGSLLCRTVGSSAAKARKSRGALVGPDLRYPERNGAREICWRVVVSDITGACGVPRATPMRSAPRRAPTCGKASRSPGVSAWSGCTTVDVFCPRQPLNWGSDRQGPRKAPPNAVRLTREGRCTHTSDAAKAGCRPPGQSTFDDPVERRAKAVVSLVSGTGTSRWLPMWRCLRHQLHNRAVSLGTPSIVH